MSSFLQVVAGAMVAVVLGLSLSKQGKDIGLLLSMAVCTMVIVVAVGFLEPVLTFMEKLRTMGNLDADVIDTILKAVGIGIIAEIADMICTDSGNGALGKAIQILAGAVILWLSLPIMTSLIELVEKILEGI